MADNMDKKIDVDEELTLDELEMVNGGHIAQTSMDYKVLSRLGLCKGESEAQIVAAWAALGVKLVPNTLGDNKYYMNGQEISQGDALKQACHPRGSSMADLIAKKHQELANRKSGYRSLSK